MRRETQNKNRELDIDEEILHGFLNINHKMRALYEGKASQKRILIILHEQNTMSQKELTQYLGVQPGSASEILSKLEKSEMIKRKQSEDDRRKMEIVLTDKGEKEAQEAVWQRKERHKQMFQCLTNEEKKELLNIFEKMNTDWENRFYLKKHYGRNEVRRKKAK